MNGPIDSLARPRTAPDSVDVGRVKQGEARELEKAGRDFEALLLGQLLKSARQTSSSGWMGEGQGVEQNVAMELAEGALAKAMAEGDALGLAPDPRRAQRPARGLRRRPYAAASSGFLASSAHEGCRALSSSSTSANKESD